MSVNNNVIYRSGDLTVQPQLGEVKNSQGVSVRLGPINMKVLVLLLSRPGELISRTEIFDSIWKNQVVNDDTLTRCISDIRAHLSQLSSREQSKQSQYIETLPKRGYRWVGEAFAENGLTISPATNKIDELQAPAAASNTASAPNHNETSAIKKTKAGFSWHRFMVQAVAYLLALLVIASLGTWLLSQVTGSEGFRIAVLPTQSSASLQASALLVNDHLIDALLDVDKLEVLSKSAVDSRPSNPFPYFFFEFNARWVIESELNQNGETLNNVISLVDARTGIVIIRQSLSLPVTAAVSSEAEGNKGSIEQSVQQAIKEIREFLESEIQSEV